MLENVTSEIRSWGSELSAMGSRINDLRVVVDTLNRTTASKEALTARSIYDVNRTVISLRNTTTQIKIQQLTRMTIQLGDLTGSLAVLNRTFMSNRASMDNSIVDITQQLETVRNAVNGIQMGSVYTRWGRKSCGGESTLLYAGLFTRLPIDGIS